MKRIFKVVLMVVLTANILVIDGFIFWNLKKENTDSLVKNNECSLDCKELISQKIIELLPTATEISPTPSKIPAPTIKTASVVLLQKISLVLQKLILISLVLIHQVLKSQF